MSKDPGELGVNESDPEMMCRGVGIFQSCHGRKETHDPLGRLFRSGHHPQSLERSITHLIAEQR